MPPPKVKLSGLSQLLAEAWERASPEGLAAVRAVVEDAALEGGRGAKMFGKNSIEVKKDLLKKGAVPNSSAGSKFNPDEQMYETNWDRMKSAEQDNGIKAWGRRDSVEAGDKAALEPIDLGTHVRKSGGMALRDDVGKAVAGHKGEGSTWSNLMEDPAYPALAAGVAGSAAALMSSNADAAEPDPYAGWSKQPAKADGKYAGWTEYPVGKAPALVGEQEATSTHKDPYAGTGGTSAPEAKPDEAGFMADLKNWLATNPTAQEVAKIGAEKETNPLSGIAKGAKVAGVLERDVLDPYVIKPLQEHVGRPILERFIAGGGSAAIPGIGPVTLPKIEGGAEYLTRSAGQFLGGKPQFEEYGRSKKGMLGISNLEDNLNKHQVLPFIKKTENAAYAASVAQLVGEAPLFLIGGSETGLLNAAKTGYLSGLLLPDVDATELAAGGALLHVGIGGLGKAAGYVVGKASDGALGLARWIRVATVPKIPEGLNKATAKATPEFVQDLTTSLPKTLATKKPKVVLSGDAEAPLPDVKPPEATGDIEHRILVALEKDPSSIPTYAVNDMKVKRPLDAIVHVDPADGKLKGVVRELNLKRGVGLHITEIKDADGLYRWKQALIRSFPGKDANTPGINWGMDDMAKAVITGDDALTNALTKRRVDPNPNRETGLMEYIPSADEAPTGLPQSAPSRVIRSVDDNWIQINRLDSPIEKAESLRGREIAAIDTEDGVRYVREVGVSKAAGKDFSGVVPFDAEEGLPTVARAGKILSFKLRKVTDSELEHLVKNPRHDTSTPDVVVAYDSERMIAGPKPKTEIIGPDKTVNIGKADKTASMGPAEPPKPPGPEPMPPAEPPVPPPPGTEQQTAIMGKVGSMNPLIRQLVPASQRAEADLADHISDFASLKNYEKMKYNIWKAMQKGIGSEKRYNEFNRDVMLAFEGKITEQQLESMYGEQVWATKKKILSDAIRIRDANDAWFREHGYLEAIDEDLELTAYEKWVNREYAADSLPPGEYLKIAKKDEAKMKMAIEGFRNLDLKIQKKMGVKNPVPMTDEAAKVKINETLGNVDKELDLFGPAKTSAKGSSATGAMKSRADLPDWYRAFKGENRDGFQAVARSLSKSEWLRQNYTIMEAISSNPKWMKPLEELSGPEVEIGADTAWKMMPNIPRLYGKAAGKYAHPFVFDTLVTLPNVPKAADGIMAGMFNFVKTNQMGFPGIRTLVNMFASNIEAGILSGGVDPTRPIASGLAMIRANKAMYEYAKNPLADNPHAQFIRDMRRIGADAPGHIGLDLNKMQAEQMQKVTDTINNYKGKRTFTDVFMAALKAHNWAAKPGSMAVDWFDRNQKLASMIMISDDLMSTSLFKLMIPGKGLGLAREEAYRRAFKRVAYSNPMFDRLPPLAERMRTGLLGAASPYSSYGMERNRIWAQLPGRILRSLRQEEDPGLVWRMAKHGILMSGLFGAYGKWLEYGGGEVSMADVDAVMKNRKGTSAAKYNPVPWAWPLRVNGQVIVMDMTQWSAPLSMMMGDQELAPIASIAMNLVRQPLNGGIIGDAVDGALKVGGIDNGDFGPQMPPPGSNGLSKAAAVGDWLAKKGGAPRLPQDIYSQVKSTGAMGDRGMRREDQPPSVATAKALGAPIEGAYTVPDGSEEGKSFSPAGFNKIKMEQGQIANIRATMAKLAIMDPNTALEPLAELADLVNKAGLTDQEAKVKILKELAQIQAGHAREIGAAQKAMRKAKQSHEMKYQNWTEMSVDQGEEQ